MHELSITRALPRGFFGSFVSFIHDSSEEIFPIPEFSFGPSPLCGCIADSHSQRQQILLQEFFHQEIGRSGRIFGTIAENLTLGTLGGKDPADPGWRTLKTDTLFF